MRKLTGHNKFMRALSAFVVQAFLITTIIPPNVFALESQFKPKSSKKEAPKASSYLSPERIRIPEDYGRKKEIHNGQNGRLVIHIQDAHAHFEAQTNIASIIDHLATEMDLELIAVEGSEGVIDTSLFASFPDEEIKREVATYFMKKGKITGPEFLSITSNHPLTLFGIEKKDLYLENLETFLNSLEYRSEAVTYLAGVEEKIETLKDKMFEGELKEFIEKEAAYSKEELTLTDYIIFLNERAQAKRVRTNRFPNAELLLDAIKLEKGIDFDEVEKERTALIDLLGKKLKKEELSDLLVKSLNFKLKTVSSSEYYHHLETLATRAKYDWSGSPNLNTYIRYINLSDRVDSEALFEELQNMAAAVKDKLFRNEAEKKLDYIAKNIKILKSFFELKLSLDEVEYYRAHRADFPIKNFISFIVEQGRKHGITSIPETRQDLIDSHLAELEHFYDVAQERDHTLVENTINRMRDDGKKVAVMITGGFHTDGVTRLLKDDGFSYVVIAPKITELDAETPYLDVMTGKKTPFEELVTREDEEEENLAITGHLDPSAALVSAEGDGITKDTLQEMRVEFAGNLLIDLLEAQQVSRERTLLTVELERIRSQWGRNLERQLRERGVSVLKRKNMDKEFRAWAERFRFGQRALVFETTIGQEIPIAAMTYQGVGEAVPGSGRQEIRGLHVPGLNGLQIAPGGKSVVFDLSEVRAAADAFRARLFGQVEPGSKTARLAQGVQRMLDLANRSRESLGLVLEQFWAGDPLARTALGLLNCQFCAISGAAARKDAHGRNLTDITELNQRAIEEGEERGYDNQAHLRLHTLKIDADTWRRLRAEWDAAGAAPGQGAAQHIAELEGMNVTVKQGKDGQPTKILFFADSRGLGAPSFSRDMIAQNMHFRVNAVLYMIFGDHIQGAVDPSEGAVSLSSVRGDLDLEVDDSLSKGNILVSLDGILSHVRWATQGGIIPSNAHLLEHNGYAGSINGDLNIANEIRVVLESTTEEGGLAEDMQGNTTDLVSLVHLIGNMGKEKRKRVATSGYVPGYQAVNRAFRLIENLEAILRTSQLPFSERTERLRRSLMGELTDLLSRFGLTADDVFDPVTLQDLKDWGADDALTEVPEALRNLPRAFYILLRQAIQSPELYDDSNAFVLFRPHLERQINSNAVPGSKEDKKTLVDSLARSRSDISITFMDRHDSGYQIGAARLEATTGFVFGIPEDGKDIALASQPPAIMQRVGRNVKMWEVQKGVYSVAMGEAELISSNNFTIYTVQDGQVYEMDVRTGETKRSTPERTLVKYEVVHDEEQFNKTSRYQKEIRAQVFGLKRTLEENTEEDPVTGLKRPRLVRVDHENWRDREQQPPVFEEGFWADTRFLLGTASGTSKLLIDLANSLYHHFDAVYESDKFRSAPPGYLDYGDALLVSSQSGESSAPLSNMNFMAKVNEALAKLLDSVTSGSRRLLHTIGIVNNSGSRVDKGTPAKDGNVPHHPLLMWGPREVAVASSGSTQVQLLNMILVALDRALHLPEDHPHHMTAGEVDRDIRYVESIVDQIENVLDSFGTDNQGAPTRNQVSLDEISKILFPTDELVGREDAPALNFWGVGHEQTAREGVGLKIMEVLRMLNNVGESLHQMSVLRWNERFGTLKARAEEPWDPNNAARLVKETLDLVTDTKGHTKFRDSEDGDPMVVLTDDQIKEAPRFLVMGEGHSRSTADFLEARFTPRKLGPTVTRGYDTRVKPKELVPGTVVVALQPDSKRAQRRLDEIAEISRRFEKEGKAGVHVCVIANEHVQAGDQTLIERARKNMLGRPDKRVYSAVVPMPQASREDALFGEIVAASLLLLDFEAVRNEMSPDELQQEVKYERSRWVEESNTLVHAQDRFADEEMQKEIDRVHKHMTSYGYDNDIWVGGKGTWLAWSREMAYAFYKQFGNMPWYGDMGQFKHGLFSGLSHRSMPIISLPPVGHPDRAYVLKTLAEIYPRVALPPYMQAEGTHGSEPGTVVAFGQRPQDDRYTDPMMEHLSDSEYQDLRTRRKKRVDNERTRVPDLRIGGDTEGILVSIASARLFVEALGSKRRANLISQAPQESAEVAEVPLARNNLFFHIVATERGRPLDKSKAEYLDDVRTLRENYPHAEVVFLGNQKSELLKDMVALDAKLGGEERQHALHVPTGHPMEHLAAMHEASRSFATDRMRPEVDYLASRDEQDGEPVGLYPRVEKRLQEAVAAGKPYSLDGHALENPTVLFYAAITVGDPRLSQSERLRVRGEARRILDEILKTYDSNIKEMEQTFRNIRDLRNADPLRDVPAAFDWQMLMNMVLDKVLNIAKVVSTESGIVMSNEVPERRRIRFADTNAGNPQFTIGAGQRSRLLNNAEAINEIGSIVRTLDGDKSAGLEPDALLDRYLELAGARFRQAFRAAEDGGFPVDPSTPIQLEWGSGKLAHKRGATLTFNIHIILSEVLLREQAKHEMRERLLDDETLNRLTIVVEGGQDAPSATPDEIRQALREALIHTEEVLGYSRAEFDADVHPVLSGSENPIDRYGHFHAFLGANVGRGASRAEFLEIMRNSLRYVAAAHYGEPLRRGADFVLWSDEHVENWLEGHTGALQILLEGPDQIRPSTAAIAGDGVVGRAVQNNLSLGNRFRMLHPAVTPNTLTLSSSLGQQSPQQGDGIFDSNQQAVTIGGGASGAVLAVQQPVEHATRNSRSRILGERTEAIREERSIVLADAGVWENADLNSALSQLRFVDNHGLTFYATKEVVAADVEGLLNVVPTVVVGEGLTPLQAVFKVRNMQGVGVIAAVYTTIADAEMQASLRKMAHEVVTITGSLGTVGAEQIILIGAEDFLAQLLGENA